MPAGSGRAVPVELADGTRSPVLAVLSVPFLANRLDLAACKEKRIDAGARRHPMRPFYPPRAGVRAGGQIERIAIRIVRVAGDLFSV